MAYNYYYNGTNLTPRKAWSLTWRTQRRHLRVPWHACRQEPQQALASAVAAREDLGNGGTGVAWKMDCLNCLMDCLNCLMDFL